jgi:hypothetical protein
MERKVPPAPAQSVDSGPTQLPDTSTVSPASPKPAEQAVTNGPLAGIDEEDWGIGEEQGEEGDDTMDL